MLADLRLAGGEMTDKVYLDCLMDGVLDKYSITSQMYGNRAIQTAAGFSGELKAEETRQISREELRDGFTVPAAAMVVTHGGNTQRNAPKMLSSIHPMKPQPSPSHSAGTVELRGTRLIGVPSLSPNHSSTGQLTSSLASSGTLTGLLGRSLR